MAGPLRILLLCVVVFLINFPGSTVAKKATKDRIWTDKEIEDEYKAWIERMVQKHAEQTAATNVTGLDAKPTAASNATDLDADQEADQEADQIAATNVTNEDSLWSRGRTRSRGRQRGHDRPRGQARGWRRGRTPSHPTPSHPTPSHPTPSHRTPSHRTPSDRTPSDRNPGGWNRGRNPSGRNPSNRNPSRQAPSSRNPASRTPTEQPMYIHVDQGGRGDFKTLTEAVMSIPHGSSTRYVITVAAGTYKEKVKITKRHGPITLIGAGNTQTKITYDDNFVSAGGTLNSASVKVYSNDFICKDIAFENSRPPQEPGAVEKQAVAFMIAGDKAAFYRVAFLGYQDTLYDRMGRHYFKDCYIRGSIDFVFGFGLSYYENCHLDSVSHTFGSLSAQRRMTRRDDSGFSFVNCEVSGPQGSIYLGRAWGPYSRIVFITTYLPVSVRPEGWSDWGVPGRSKTVFYGEYECYGPGANRQGRESWSLELTYRQAEPFMTVSWIQGSSWLPLGQQ